MTHTPTPWKIKALHKKMTITGNVHQICDGDNYPTAFVPAWDNPQAGEVDGTEEALANAALIVHAVNSLPALVKALEDAQAFINSFVSDSEPPALHVPDGFDGNVFASAWDAASTSVRSALASHKTGG
jgi:hypothetical protein